MLVLTRRVGEAILIESNIRITVTAIEGNRVRLGIMAPADVRIDRSEVHERREAQKRAARLTPVVETAHERQAVS